MSHSINSNSKPIYIQSYHEDTEASIQSQPTTPVVISGAEYRQIIKQDERTALLGGKEAGPATSAVSNTLKLLFFICGLSTFARSESILMQTQMYANCFGLGPRFYPASSAALFMPGIIIQLIQNRYDKMFDRKFTTFRAANTRLMLSMFSSLSALTMMLVATYHSPSTRKDGVFIYAMLAIVGIGISITFGSFAQIVSMFPQALHPFFFMGTYAPFFIFAPVNIAVKDLCEPIEKMGELEEWVIRWNSVAVYYIVAIIMTLAGLVCFYGIAYHPYGRRTFRHKDEELATLNDNGPVRIKDAPNGDGDNTSILSTRSPSVSDEPDPEEEPLTSWGVLRFIWREVVAQSAVTIISTIVAALYIDLRPTHFLDLPTILVYNYYICASVGTVLTSWTRFTNLFTPNRLVLLAATRIVFVPMAILYARDVIKFHNDYVVIALNSVNMLIGGTVFSLSFSMACSKFRAKPVRSAASTMMNIFYYVAMAVGMGISFGLNK